MAADELHGVVVVDKPGGMTSAAVVARVKRALRVKRVGHTGTLDPMATGVLPLCLGEGTKLAGFLLADDKAYEATLELGVETDTLDADGQVTRERREAAAAVVEDALRECLTGFVGAIEQVPPMYSAIRHQGKRLHELARKGVEVERPARPVVIHALELTGFDGPFARLRVHCSKGTYIRTLVADVGAALECGARLTQLRRTASGRFRIGDSVALESLDDRDLSLEERRARARAHLVTPEVAVDTLATVQIEPDRVTQVRNGLQLGAEQIGLSEMAPKGPYRLLNEAGQLLAIAELSDGKLRYSRVFTYALT